MVEIKSEENNTVQLPNNIRQVGTPGEKIKIYIEDYVITYLRRLAGEETLNNRVAILLGHTEQMDGLPYLFIRGAYLAHIFRQLNFPLRPRFFRIFSVNELNHTLTSLPLFSHEFEHPGPPRG